MQVLMIRGWEGDLVQGNIRDVVRYRKDRRIGRADQIRIVRIGNSPLVLRQAKSLKVLSDVGEFPSCSNTDMNNKLTKMM